MSGLNYLFLTGIKNSIKELRRNPARLITVIIFVALLIFVVISSLNENKLEVHEYRSINEFCAIVFALYTYVFVSSSIKGLSSGASFYSMADVNILFSTPISSKKILIYGLIKQMGTSLLVGFFLLYQYSWLNMTYGISIAELVAVLLGYCIVVFCSQLTAMTIYSFSSNDEKLQRIIKNTFIVTLSIVGAYIFYRIFSGTGKIINITVDAVNSFWLNFIPVAGWMKMAVLGYLSSDYRYVAGGLIMAASYIVIFIYTVTKVHSDYYEDVLLATEISHSAITAKKEGHVVDSRKNVKIGRTGLNKGRGASVFFYKHLIENRRSGLILLDKTSIIFILVTVFYSYITRNTFSQDSGRVLSIFIFATYMQIFSSAMGRWLRELIMPYVYMVPENPFIKLVGICQENILKIIVEASVLFVIIGFLLQISPFMVAACILGRIGFGILFMSGNILTERILGTIGSKVILLFFYIIIMIVLAAPGVLLAIFAAASYGNHINTSMNLGLTIVFLWNILISAAVAFFCRDILNYAELNNK